METSAARVRVPALGALLAGLAIAAPAAPAAGSADRLAGVAPRSVSFAPARTYGVDAGPGVSGLPSPGAVAVGDLNGDGKLDLAVANYLSDDVSVLLGDGDGSFRALHNQSAGPVSPRAVAIGDLNGDGKPDLAVADGEGGVSVLAGRGNGKFSRPRRYAGDAGAESVAIGDLNGDGKPDVALGYDDGVAVLLGGGDRLRPPRYYQQIEACCSVSIGDLNRDGKPDLAVAGDGVAVLLGNGDGNFRSIPPARGYRASEDIASVEVADLNGDGTLDLVAAAQRQVTTQRGSWTLRGALIMLGRGDGTFLLARWVRTDSTLVSVGDLNGDGTPDLAVASSSSSRLSVLLGDGKGGFRAARDLARGNSLTIGDAPAAITLADLNGDHKADLVVGTTGQGAGHVSVLLNTSGRPAAPPAKSSKLAAPSTLSFAAKGSYRVGGSAVVADLNGDHEPDLAAVTPSGRVSVLLGEGNGRFRAAHRYRVSYESAQGRALGMAPAVALADLNGDAKPDLVVAAHHVSALLGRGDGSFRAAAGYPHQTSVGDKGDNWQAVAVGDLTHDEKTDLVVSTFGDGADQGDLLLLLGNGNGGFRAGDHISDIGHFLGATSVTVGEVGVGDLNGDRMPDLVTATLRTLTVQLGRPHGKLQTVSRYRISQSLTPAPLPSFAIGDLNDDGKLDLAVVDSGTLTVLLGKGNGHFLSSHRRASGDTVAIGDLNADGHPDLALGISGGVSVLLGDGKGRFRRAGAFRVAAGDPSSLTVADLNGDGRQDLIVGTTGQTSGHMSVLLNATPSIQKR